VRSRPEIASGAFPFPFAVGGFSLPLCDLVRPVSPGESKWAQVGPSESSESKWVQVRPK
jgi:hypothetical protein